MGTTHDGAFHGHYLSACARTIALARDGEIAAKTEALIAALSRYQQPDGALWIGTVTKEALHGLHAGTLQNHAYYTIHKLIMGLFEMGTLGGSSQALGMAIRLADFTADLFNRATRKDVTTALACEHGGIAEIMFDVAVFTGEQRHFDAALRLLDRTVIDPLSRGEDILTKRHANTTIPILQGAARAYELTGDRMWRDAVERFYTLVHDTRLLATGGDCSVHEHWTAPLGVKAELCAETQETCASYNWLRLTEYLLRWTADPAHADAYERGQVNGILAAQHPRTGMFVYFMPMKPGPRGMNPDNYDPDPPEAGCKHFGRPLRSFWCCYGTGVQAFSNPASAAIYKRGDGVVIGQYVSSVVSAEVGGVPLRLEVRTEFPYSDTVTLIVRMARPTRFPLEVRVPWWTGDGASAEINFKPVTDGASAMRPGTWLTLDREWGESDMVRLTFPMHHYTEAIHGDPDCVALMYGPHVMAGCGGEYQQFRMPKDRPGERLSAAGEDPFAFVDAGSPPVVFKPLSRVVDEEYHVYFQVTP